MHRHVLISSSLQLAGGLCEIDYEKDDLRHGFKQAAYTYVLYSDRLIDMIKQLQVL